MILDTKIYKSGKFWLAEVPALDAMTQGRTKVAAMRMLEDWIRNEIDRPKVEVRVTEVKPNEIVRLFRRERFQVETNEDMWILAAILRRQRMKRGLTVRDVAKALGSDSPNAYAAYEQGKREPSLTKLQELLEAIDPNNAPKLRVG